MMNLYSGVSCPLSHRCRIVLYEKGMDFQVIDLDVFDNSIIPESVSGIKISEEKKKNRVPILEDRDLLLFDASVIGEFIDERFPHPQLMPPDPIMRARARQILLGLEREIFYFMMVLENEYAPSKDKDKAKKQIVEQLLGIVPVFNRQKYLLGDEFSMLDVAMAPLLWRLQHYQISFSTAESTQISPLMKYAERIFARQGFIDSLTPAEKAMRK